jgi:hypothetical protein
MLNGLLLRIVQLGRLSASQKAVTDISEASGGGGMVPPGVAVGTGEAVAVAGGIVPPGVLVGVGVCVSTVATGVAVVAVEVAVGTIVPVGVASLTGVWVASGVSVGWNGVPVGSVVCVGSGVSVG